MLGYRDGCCVGRFELGDFEGERDTGGFIGRRDDDGANGILLILKEEGGKEASVGVIEDNIDDGPIVLGCTWVTIVGIEVGPTLGMKLDE